MPKTYDQQCPVAVALDVVGDRWSLLIVRELLLGQERWGQLRDGLPGIAKNLLVDRLRGLEAAGVLVHEGDRYVLTDEGRRLQPVLAALVGWGIPRLATGPRPATTRPHWVRFAAELHPHARLVALDDEEAVVELGGRELRGAHADVLQAIVASAADGSAGPLPGM